MKKIWLFILWLCTTFFACNFTQAKDYEYTNLDITANILNDGTINVNEKISANFFVNKHWIIRDIPLNYSVEWKDFHIEVSNINVDWKNFTTSKNNWNIEIKIWDANRTLIWEQDYPISYSTYWLIRNFSWMWYAELYWNLVGYKFDTNINKIRAELILPKTYTWFTADDFLITTDGTTKTIDWFGWTVDWSRWNKIIIIYDRWLSAFQGITLAIKFPNNYFEFDHSRQTGLIWNIDNDFTIDNFNFINNILRWSFVLFKEKYPVIIQYNPPSWLNSAEVWILLHRYIDPKDSFSLVYKWANEWIIEIQSWKNFSDISLVKIKDIPWNYPEYEKILFNKLFFKNELILDNKTYLYNKLIDSWLQNYWIEKWRFTKKETNWCNNIWCFYVILVFIWTPILCSIFPFLGLIFFLVLWGIWFFWWQKWLLQARTLEETEKGAQFISHILWYKQFLKTCDENKLRLFLQEDPLYFDKILPYAVVFGLDTELIRKITPIMQEMNIKPTWYYWNINSLSKVTHKINNMAYSQRPSHNSWSSSYSSDSWFSSWSSFSSWWSSFSSGWWGGGGWWRSW